jgi:hypothetical protein
MRLCYHGVSVESGSSVRLFQRAPADVGLTPNGPQARQSSHSLKKSSGYAGQPIISLRRRVLMRVPPQNGQGLSFIGGPSPAWSVFAFRAAVNPSMDAAGKTSVFFTPRKANIAPLLV